MSPPERTPARLVLQRTDDEEIVYTLDKDRSMTLGREAGNTIVLASRFVSKQHALVAWTPRGVRIEDRDSANGITVNGLNVQATQLSSGDVIQIGDQRLVFEIERDDSIATPAEDREPGGKQRLRSFVAMPLTMLVIVGGLAALCVLFAPGVDRVTPSTTAARGGRSVAPATKITPFDSPQAAAIAQQALAAYDNPVDRLFDQGQVAYEAGRLLDAYRLLHGALLRDSGHEPARRLLLRVTGDRERRLNGLQAAAGRADEDLKFDEAARQWAEVQALTLDNEPLNARARRESARLRQRASQ